MRPAIWLWLTLVLGAYVGACERKAAESDAVQHAQQLPPVEVPVEVVVTAEPTYRLAQEEMLVSIAVRNVGARPIELPIAMSAPLHWLDLDVIGPDGKEVPPRAPGMQTPGWYQRSKVAPGESREVSQDVRLIKAINAPGLYRLKVRFGQSPRPDVPNFVAVVSATKTFVIER